MIRFGTIKRITGDNEVEVEGLGGTTKERLVMPAGTNIDPSGMDCLVIPMGDGSNTDIVIPLKEHDGKVKAGGCYVGRGGSYIHFDGSKIDFFGEVEFHGSSILHQGKEIGKDHKHTDSAGDKITKVD